MQTEATDSKHTYIPFWNRIRYLVVLCVVVHHGACAYSKYVPWWYANSGQTAPLFDLAVATFDLFIMPVLFFVSGYFALPSLRHHGPGGFLRIKIRHLFLPLIFLTVFYVPIIHYISSIAWGRNPSGGFFAYWKHVVTSVTPVCWRVFDSVEKTVPYIDDMTPNYLWYLTLLLLFLLVFLVVEIFSARASDKGTTHAPQSGGRMLGVLAAFGVVISLAMAAICMFFPFYTWVQASSFLVLQPIRIPQYAGIFFLGVYACRHNWFVRRALPGPLWLWILGLVASELAFLNGHNWLSSWPFAYALLWAAERTAFALCMVALLTSAGFRYWTRTPPVHMMLSKTSYDRYLLHLPLMVAIQYALRTVEMSVYLKFTLGVVVTLILCLVASLATRKKSVWVRGGGILAVFTLVCLLT